MKSTPLLMKGPLVRATLAGVKTETRRMVTSLNGIGKVSRLEKDSDDPRFWNFRDSYLNPHFVTEDGILCRCPYGGPGDRLWVREMFSITELGEYAYGRQEYPKAIHHPAIHMPREACRLDLEILERSIEFIQDITDEAIRAEGVADLTLDDLLEMGASRKAIIACVASVFPRLWHNWKGLMYAWPSFALRDRFQIVWDLIYGADPATRWSAKPTVWVLKYRKVTT